MQLSHIRFQNNIVSYRYGGTGTQALICFHGYGESSQSFSFLENHLANNYTLIAIDMPFHGETRWPSDKEFNSAHLKELTELLLAKHGLTARRISLAGFSMGGRIALSLVSSMAKNIDKVILMAPDGLKVNFWYWFATQTWFGNKLFAITIDNPGLFLWFLKICNKLKFVNQSVYKFVHYYLDDKKTRKLLYLRWTNLRKLKPDLSEIRKIIRDEQINVHLLYGKHDRIILSGRGLMFQKDIEKWCSVDLLNCGHQVLHEKNARDIIRYL